MQTSTFVDLLYAVDADLRFTLALVTGIVVTRDAAAVVHCISRYLNAVLEKRSTEDLHVVESVSKRPRMDSRIVFE